MSDERRRHPRGLAPVTVELVLAGAAVPVARVVDASASGLLVELAAGATPPPLHTVGRAIVTRDAQSLVRQVRVVRVRWAGRDRGATMPSALAVTFET